MKKLVKKAMSSFGAISLVLSSMCCMLFAGYDNIIFFDAEALDNKYNVLVLNFDPIIPLANNKKQHELVDWWNDPHDLALQFKKDMYNVSHGYANYNIVDWVEIDEMPRSTLGKQYTVDYYYNTLQAAIKEKDGGYWSSTLWEDYGATFDYDYYMSLYNVYDRVNNGEVDEVWIFTGPMVGVWGYESHMIGRNAYWCNSPGMEYDCKPFVAYCFNYERDIGCMLEDAGHRFESVMNEIMGWPDYTKNYSKYTDWEKFTAYDLVCSGKAGVGNVHFAPNSLSDYDWGNKTFVMSYCNDWVNYPNMTAEPESVNCASWGMGDMAEHHRWWLNLIPHAQGVNEKTSFYNNWWIYFTLDYINNPLYADPKTAVSIEKEGFIFDYQNKQYYTGKEITPDIVISYRNVTFKKEVDYTVSYFDNIEYGTGKIVISGKDKLSGTVSLDFIIVKSSVSTIKVIAPNKKEYYIGDKLDVSGGKVTVSYSDDKEDDLIDLEPNMCTGFDSSVAGKKTITVTYEDKTATFEVTVKEPAPPVPAGNIVATFGGKKETFTDLTTLAKDNAFKAATGAVEITINADLSTPQVFAFPSKATSFKLTAPEAHTVTLKSATLTAKGDLTLENITLKTAKGAAAVTAKKNLTATNCTFGKTGVTGDAVLENCTTGALAAKGNLTITGGTFEQITDSGKVTTTTTLGGVINVTKNLTVSNNLVVSDGAEITVGGKFTPKASMTMGSIKSFTVKNGK